MVDLCISCVLMKMIYYSIYIWKIMVELTNLQQRMSYNVKCHGLHVFLKKIMHGVELIYSFPPASPIFHILNPLSITLKAQWFYLPLQPLYSNFAWMKGPVEVYQAFLALNVFWTIIMHSNANLCLTKVNLKTTKTNTVDIAV